MSSEIATTYNNSSNNNNNMNNINNINSNNNNYNINNNNNTLTMSTETKISKTIPDSSSSHHMSADTAPGSITSLTENDEKANSRSAPTSVASDDVIMTISRESETGIPDQVQDPPKTEQ